MTNAERILSKYKNKLRLKANPQSKKSWLIHTINEITRTPNKKMKKHKIKFDDTPKSAKWNAKLLKRCNHNLIKLLEKEHHTMMQPGSKFRTVETLEPLFRHHKLWPMMKAIIESGVEYPLEEITKYMTFSQNQF